MLSHGGAIPGFSSFIAFFPNDNLGIAVLANAGDKGPVVQALLYRVAEIALNLRRIPQAEEYVIVHTHDKPKKTNLILARLHHIQSGLHAQRTPTLAFSWRPTLGLIQVLDTGHLRYAILREALSTAKKSSLRSLLSTMPAAYHFPRREISRSCSELGRESGAHTFA